MTSGESLGELRQASSLSLPAAAEIRRPWLRAYAAALFITWLCGPPSDISGRGQFVSHIHQGAGHGENFTLSILVHDLDVKQPDSLGNAVRLATNRSRHVGAMSVAVIAGRPRVGHVPGRASAKVNMLQVDPGVKHVHVNPRPQEVVAVLPVIRGEVELADVVQVPQIANTLDIQTMYNVFLSDKIAQKIRS